MMILAAVMFVSATITFSPCLDAIENYIGECGDGDNDDYGYTPPVLKDCSLAGGILLLINAVISSAIYYVSTTALSKSIHKQEIEDLERSQQRLDDARRNPLVDDGDGL